MPAVVTTKPSIRYADLQKGYRRKRGVADVIREEGSWSEEEYFDLDEGCLLEFTHGNVEVLPMANPSHQRIVSFLFRLLHEFVMSHGLGDIVFAPMPVRIGSKEYREPDIAFLSADHAELEEAECWGGADLVVEVVSKGAPKRDLIQKRKEYAKAGISEYWIVQPQESVVLVLNLKGRSYQERRFQLGDIATSQRLAGFEVAVADLFGAGNPFKPQRKNGKKS